MQIGDPAAQLEEARAALGELTGKTVREDVPARMPFYRVLASMADTARVGMVAGGNFALGLDGDGALLPVIADPEAVFAWDTALARPALFAEGGLAAVLGRTQRSSNLLPCAFFAAENIP